MQVLFLFLLLVYKNVILFLLCLHAIVFLGYALFLLLDNCMLLSLLFLEGFYILF